VVKAFDLGGSDYGPLDRALKGRISLMGADEGLTGGTSVRTQSIAVEEDAASENSPRGEDRSLSEGA